MNRRTFFSRLGQCVAAAAFATHLKLGEICPIPLPVIECPPIAPPKQTFTITEIDRTQYTLKATAQHVRQDGYATQVVFSTSLYQLEIGDEVSISGLTLPLRNS